MHLEIGKLACSLDGLIQTYSFNTFKEIMYEYNTM